MWTFLLFYVDVDLAGLSPGLLAMSISIPSDSEEECHTQLEGQIQGTDIDQLCLLFTHGKKQCRYLSGK